MLILFASYLWQVVVSLCQAIYGVEAIIIWLLPENKKLYFEIEHLINEWQGKYADGIELSILWVVYVSD